MIKLILFVMLVATALPVIAYTPEDIQKLKNDKEVVTLLSKRTIKKLKAKFQNQSVIEERSGLFYDVILSFLNSSKKDCEFRLIKELSLKLQSAGLPHGQEDMIEFYGILRIHHYIDDIFYEILEAATIDYFGLLALDLERKGKTLRGHEELVKNNDPEILFDKFREFPDDKNSCLYQEYNSILNSIVDQEGKKTFKLKDFKRLTTKAYMAGIITKESFLKLRYLQDNGKINKQEIWLNDYFRIIFRAKNKMIPLSYSYEAKDVSLEENFSTERIKRFSRITRRKLLYRKYNETQFILLSQVLQKASRRMGVDADTESKAPVITQEFNILNPDGTRRNYVEVIELDPQSQYNLARRLLRKDILDLQMMDAFVKNQITYQDVVMAALETGYVSLEEISYVVKYDDLWNPEKSKFQRISGFIFTVAGYSTFFLPPPWNITASIALGIVEGVVDNKFKTGAENDNPATFIE